MKQNERTSLPVIEESRVISELDEWRFREELLWKQRSMVDWLKEGDLNTKYFHSRSSQRFKVNFLYKLINKDGMCLSDKHGLRSLALYHFFDIFKTSRTDQNIQWNRHMDVIKGSISEDSIRILNEPFLTVDIREAFTNKLIQSSWSKWLSSFVFFKNVGT